MSFVPLGPPVEVEARCIVCGVEFDVPRFILERAARSAHDGDFTRLDSDGPWVRAQFPDGKIAASCSSHSSDEVRTAYVLTEWKLTEEET